MKFIKKNWHKIVLLAYVFFAPVFLLSADSGGPIVDPNAGKILNPLGTTGPNSIPVLIEKILVGVIKIGLPVIALAIIYCGFLFVKAQGKPTELKEAKGALLYTLIGAAILLGAWALARMISATVLSL